MKRLLLFLLLIQFLAPVAFAQTSGETLDTKSFFYTAVWDSAANDILPTTLQRVQISTAEYEKAKSSFIEEFVRLASTAAAAPGAVPGATVAPPPAAGAAPQQAEIHLSLDPKVQGPQAPLVFSFDVQPVQLAVAAGNDPHALGEWTFYFWQNYLWQNYVSRGALMLSGIVTFSDVDRFNKVIQEKREPIWTWTEVDASTREPKEWVQSTREYPAMPLPGETEVQVLETLRTQSQSLNGQVLDPQRPILWDSELAVGGLMRIYYECAYALDAMAHDQYWGFVNGLRERQEQRTKYAEWLGDRQSIVEEYAKDWARKYDGTEFDVDGVQFLVSEKTALENMPSNARNIIVDKQVVPYDLLNEDGTLKRPIPTED